MPERGRWTGQGAASLLAGASQQSAQGHDDPVGALDLDRLVFANRAGTTPSRRPLHAYAAVSASMVLAATLAWGWQLRGAIDSSSHSTVMGTVQSVPLADGSRTVLGSDSRIDVRLSRSERRIDLQQGEAFSKPRGFASTLRGPSRRRGSRGRTASRCAATAATCECGTEACAGRPTRARLQRPAPCSRGELGVARPRG